MQRATRCIATPGFLPERLSPVRVPAEVSASQGATVLCTLTSPGVTAEVMDRQQTASRLAALPTWTNLNYQLTSTAAF